MTPIHLLALLLYGFTMCAIGAVLGVAVGVLGGAGVMLDTLEVVRLFALIGLLGCVLALLDIGEAWAEERWRWDGNPATFNPDLWTTTREEYRR